MMLAIDQDLESKEIVRRYRKLLRSAKPFLKDDDASEIRKAFELAVDAHKDMRRKSGEPYIYHPIAVAQICVEEIGLGTTSIIAALLHDVVEDTAIELWEIEEKFGSKIARIIDGLTKISGVFQSDGGSQQAENFKKVLLTLTDDVRVIFIKLADRLHNMRTLDSMSRNSQLKIASETIYLYAPLAHRLGLYTIKSELEDLYVKYTHTEKYFYIAEKIKQTKAARNKFIKDFITPIENELKKQGLHFNIKGRPKSIYSIMKKMEKKNLPFDEIYDLFAIRIILNVPIETEKAACWQVYSVVTDFYKPNPDRLRDWLSTPRSNGYESLHTTVMSKTGQWVEVQIRTERMDEIAEKGYAAHWKYKENVTQPNTEHGLESWLLKVRDVMSSNDSNAIEFINDFRSNLFQDEVYVFTKNGDMKVLPAGATILDFAYEIHSEVGNKCMGAKVNLKLVPLNHKLSNGDQIEIITSAKHKPNEDWLKFVTTSKARNKIREALKEEKKQIASFGKEMVARKLKNMKEEMSDELISDMRTYFSAKNNIELFALFATQKLKQPDLKRFVADRKLPKTDRTHSNHSQTYDKTVVLDGKGFEKELKKIRGNNTDSLLIGEDLDKFDYKLAPCCNPIPGDDVFGFVTVSEGIKIHRTSCPNAVELMSNYGYRIIKAKWTSQTELAFLAGLKLTGIDRIGLVNEVTDVISKFLKVNIRSISFTTEEGIFEGILNVFVQDTDQLVDLIERLKMIDGIGNVFRFDGNS